MLINCTECGSQISDKALFCPHCGLPMDETKTKKTVRKKKTNRRRKLPNGYGRITEIKNRNLRKPFRVMVTVGKDEYGKPIGKLLKPNAYFETYNDAFCALVAYNTNPYELDGKSVTMQELYDMWFPEYCETVSDGTARFIITSWRYAAPIHSMIVKDVKIHHLKGCIDDAHIDEDAGRKDASINVKSKLKTIFNMMFDYAIVHGLVEQNYARQFIIKKTSKENQSIDISSLFDDGSKEITVDLDNLGAHNPFTDVEMSKLWDHRYEYYNDLVIIQCYTGLRPQEIGLIKIDDTDLKHWVFVGGIKTDAGINRVIPIHSKIRELVKRRYDEAVSIGSKYLFNATDKRGKKDTFLSYHNYHDRFDNVVKNLQLGDYHSPHDCRKHFTTAAKKYKVDQYAIKYIIGHKIKDLTERVYTQREIEWLQTEIEKIK